MLGRWSRSRRGRGSGKFLHKARLVPIETSARCWMTSLTLHSPLPLLFKVSVGASLSSCYSCFNNKKKDQGERKHPSHPLPNLKASCEQTHGMDSRQPKVRLDCPGSEIRHFHFSSHGWMDSLHREVPIEIGSLIWIPMLAWAVFQRQGGATRAGRVLVARLNGGWGGGECWGGSFSPRPLLWASLPCSHSHALFCWVVGNLAFHSSRINVSV